MSFVLNFIAPVNHSLKNHEEAFCPRFISLLIVEYSAVDRVSFQSREDEYHHQLYFLLCTPYGVIAVDLVSQVEFALPVGYAR